MAIINGNKSANTLNGTSSSDTVNAYQGNDVIRGYGGNDTLSGGSGSDTFIFESTALANGVDTLMDYKYNATKGAEQDILDLTALFGALSTKTIMSNYAKFDIQGGKVVLRVDKDGTGNSYTFETIAVFDNFTGGESVRIKAGTNLFTLPNAPTPAPPPSGEVTATELLAISGTVNVTGVTKITGTGADVKAVFDKTNLTLSSSVAVDITNAATIAQLTAIDAATSGTLTYTAVGDTSANLATDAATNSAAGTYVTGSKNVTLTDAHTLAQLVAINHATTGTITLFNNSVALSGTGADITAALSGITGYTGGLTVTDIQAIAQLTAIDAATSGTLTYTAVGDTSANLATDAATNSAAGTYVTGSKNVTLTDAHTLAQLVAINHATTGTITLFNNSVALSGTGADITAALSGITGYTGGLTVTDIQTIAQLTAIDAATSGTLTYTAVGDTSANLAADAATNSAAGTYVTGSKNVTLTDAHTLAQLVAINHATTGTITLFNNSVALSGTGADITAALSGITGYTGNLDATGTANADTIDLSSLSTGVIAVNGGALDDIITTGSNNDFITGGTGNDTLTGGSGSDTYIFAFGTTNGVDTITDFVAGAAGDIIDLTGTSDVSINANSNEGNFGSQALSSGGTNAADIALTNGFTKITGVSAATQSTANIETALANSTKAGVCVGNMADVVYIAIGVADVDASTGGNQGGTVIARVTGGSDTVINAADITVLAVLVGGVTVSNLTTDNFSDF